MPIRVEHKKYPSFGECIYCGASGVGVELTDEHIVPFSLGGNAVIEDGSCKDCALQTTRIEYELARRVYWDFRAHVNAPTRRKKERPSELPFSFSVGGGAPQTKVVPVADQPYFTPMPVWGLPGLLTGRPPTCQFEHHKAHVFYWIPPNIKETLELDDGVPAEIPFPEFRINHEYFARAIAKIAYCEAVAYLGLHTFRRLVLPALILGRYPYIPHFVGCSIDDPPAPNERGALHVTQVGFQQIRGMRLVIATVRLFANSGIKDHGPPVYEVVVGAPGLSRR
jgi:HNH endonuclease